MTLSSDSPALGHPADSSFLIETHRRPGCTSFDIIGALTARSTITMEALIRRETAQVSPGHHFRIDLLRCSELTPAATRALGNAHEYCAERDLMLYLARVPDPLVKLIEAEHLMALLEPPWV